MAARRRLIMGVGLAVYLATIGAAGGVPSEPKEPEKPDGVAALPPEPLLSPTPEPVIEAPPAPQTPRPQVPSEVKTEIDGVGAKFSVVNGNAVEGSSVRSSTTVRCRGSCAFSGHQSARVTGSHAR